MDKTLRDEPQGEALIDVIKEFSPGSRLSCSKAREIAERFGIPLSEIGRLANELRIKIIECELGCF